MQAPQNDSDQTALKAYLDSLGVRSLPPDDPVYQQGAQVLLGQPQAQPQTSPQSEEPRSPMDSQPSLQSPDVLPSAPSAPATRLPSSRTLPPNR
jgi:hypothetical protein